LTSSHTSLEDALSSVAADENVNRAFLMGGAQLYNLALQANPPLVDRVLLTRVLSEFECDVFLHDFSAQTEAWKLASHVELCEWVGWEVPGGDVEEKGVKYRYEMWVRR
jgi:dihydrofolate reductase